MCEQKCGRDWSGDVVVCLNQRVTSDFHPVFWRFQCAADPGEHTGSSNQHGALSVRTAEGQLLGVKPAEVAWWRYADSDERYVWGHGAWALAVDELERLSTIVAGRACSEGATP